MELYWDFVIKSKYIKKIDNSVVAEKLLQHFTEPWYISQSRTYVLSFL